MIIAPVDFNGNWTTAEPDPIGEAMWMNALNKAKKSGEFIPPVLGSGVEK